MRRRFLAFGFILLFLCVFSYVYRFNYNKNFLEVIPGKVYRSAQPTENNIVSWKEKYKIKSILNARGLRYISKDKSLIKTYQSAASNNIDTRFIELSSRSPFSRQELLDIINILETFHQ